jgi:type II secretory pathway component PulJ
MRAGRARRRLSDEAGLTVLEVTISMVLMLAVVPIVGPVMISSMRTGTHLQAHSEVLDELRLQGMAIARELRSAECIHEPTLAANSNRATSSRLRFTTNTDGVVYEVTYEVLDGQLVRTQGTTSRIVGRALEGGSDAFTHNATPRRTVDLRFHVRVEDKADTLRTTIAGRNAWLSLNC